MDKMRFGVFTWQENPESFCMEAVREPIYVEDEYGVLQYDKMGPVCRVITGAGVFRGQFAYQDFNTLHVLMQTGVAMELVHPLWGTYSAILTELTLRNTSRDHYVEYTFTFREADLNGSVPRLPDFYFD